MQFKFNLKSVFGLLSLLLVVSLAAACGGAATPAAPAPAQQAAAPTEAPVEGPTEAPAIEPTATPMPAPTQAPQTQTTMATESKVQLPAVDPLAITGNIIVAGSSTVYPLTERLAERFQAEGYSGQITIDSIGSGAGFQRFCEAGESDISNASRPIKDSEVENCAKINRTPVEFRVGTDALAVVVSSANDFVDDVTLAELALLFSTAEKWSDVRPDWPAEPVQRFSPGTDSGTFDYFVEAVMDPAFVKDKDADKGKGKEAILKASNLQLSEDDNVLAAGVAGSPYAIGYFGYAYYAADQGELKALSIEGVAPTADSAEDGTYPLARPLFIYSDPGVMAEKPQVAAFINFYLTHVNEEVLDVGYFPASGAALDTAKQNWLAAMGAAAEMAAAAPTEKDMAMAPGQLPAIDPLNVTGNIIVAGSSTVYPLTERLAERFQAEGYSGQITIDSIGSGAGFQRFCEAGESDISNASRPIKDSEVENCAKINRTPVEFRVGTDALAVVVSSANDFVDDVTLAELALLFSTAEKWSDVRPDWPAEPVQRFSPGTDSGTFDYFVEAVMDPAFVKDKDADKGKGKEAILKASNLQLSEDDNVLAAGVAGSPYAIGYFGYAYYAADQGELKALSIEGVAPTADSAEDGTYPLARPLFIYSDPGVMAEKPQVAAFINFYLTHVNEEVLDVGYFPASDTAINTAKTNWLAAMGQ